MFVDFRAGRSFNAVHNDKRAFLGSDQVEAIGAALGVSISAGSGHLPTPLQHNSPPVYGSDPVFADLQAAEDLQARSSIVGQAPEGVFSECSTLLAVHSMPLVLVSTGRSKCLASCCSAQVDKMGFGLHPKEQNEYIQMLETWQSRGDGKRKVLALAGDLHFGATATIRDSGKPCATRVFNFVCCPCVPLLI